MNENYDEIDNLLFNYFDSNKSVPNIVTEKINTALNFQQKRIGILEIIKKIIITILSICTITGGIVFAKNYIFNTFGLGDGIDTAVENGYIYEPPKDINNYEIVNGTDIQASIEQFLMDDQNISTNFSFNISAELLKNFNIKNIIRIELSDLIITDENNVILYCANEQALNEFCKKNNLNYKFGEFNDTYYNCGVNNILQPSSKNNIINVTYNIYSGGLENSYPKSKNLKYKFHEIKILENSEKDTDGKILKGDWEINIDVPEEMYNRQSINYKVVECSNENIEISTAKVTNTGFEFGCVIHNIEVPDRTQEIQKYKQKLIDDYNNATTQEEKEIIYDTYRGLTLPVSPINSFYDPVIGETIEDCTYIENQNKEKFLISYNPGRNQKGNFINNKDYDFYETFNLTKYDITDELTIHLVVYDKVIIIKLQKN